MGMTTLSTWQHHWKRETLTTKQVIGQMLEHLAQVYDLLQQTQAALRRLHLEVKALRQGGRDV